MMHCRIVYYIFQGPLSRGLGDDADGHKSPPAPAPSAEEISQERAMENDGLDVSTG
jgi:hypothetical protein